MKKSTSKLFGFAVIAAIALALAGCPTSDDVTVPEVDNTIASVLISLGYDNDPPKAGKVLTATAKNASGDYVSGVSYQWKRGDSETGAFSDIVGAGNSGYTPTSNDADKYIKVEATNSSTPVLVLSGSVGPVDANQVDALKASASGTILKDQAIKLTTETASAIIYYTLDGTTPTSSSTRYDSWGTGIKISSSCTLKAIAQKSGLNDSEVLTVEYTVIPLPTFSLVSSSLPTFNSSARAITYGNNLFVAGSNGLAWSTNGTSWTAATGTGASIGVYGITYGNNRFVAVGRYGYISYSVDGKSWTKVDGLFDVGGIINDVAYGGGKYVAVGRELIDSAAPVWEAKTAYSTDGETWTIVDTPSFGDSEIMGVTYGAGKFIAVGENGKMEYSADGTVWSPVSDPKFGTNTVYGITYGGPAGSEKFVAVGRASYGGYARAYSSDGITWEAVSDTILSGALAKPNRVAWGGNKFIAVAGEGVMLVSADGISWLKMNGGTGTGNTQFDDNLFSSINDIAFGGGKFVAVGTKSVSSTTSGQIAVSTN